MTYAEICNCVYSLKKRFKNEDAISIAESLGIIVKFDSLGTSPGSLKGYFIEYRKIPVITINGDLPDILQRIIAAHELCHALNHRNCELLPFHDISLFDETSILEKEANMFAAEFLLDDEEVIDVLNQDYTFFSAAILGVPPELLDFKFRVMKWKGYKLVEPPITARSNFLRDVEVPYGSDDYSC